LFVSKGKLPSNPDFYVIPPWFEIEITDLSSSPAGEEPPAYILSLGMSTTNKVKVEGRVVPKRLFTSLCAFVKGFLVGEEESAAGIAGDVIASFLVWGDLRDFFKELVKGILPGQKADWVVFGFATLGLATTLYPPADPFVAIAKVVVKVCRRLGAVGKRLAEILVRQGTSAVQRALNGDLSMMNALKEFLEKVVGRPPIQDQIERIKRLASLVKSHKSFACGDWLKIGKDITADQLQRLQKTVAELVGAKVIDRSLEGLLTECLSKLGKEVKEEIADLADNVRKEVMKGMARALGKGVAPEWMATALNRTDIFSANYTRRHFLEDLSKVADVEGIDRLFSPTTMRGSSPGLASSYVHHAEGALFELQAAAQYVDDGKSILKLREKIRGDDEVDIILTDGTFVEVQLGDVSSNYKDMNRGRVKVTTAKLARATKVEFVFSEKSKISNDWINAVKDQAGKLNIVVEVKRLIIHPNGTKSWVKITP
jgi:Holliday junction resolvase-like predicted endonuclease